MGKKVIYIAGLALGLLGLVLCAGCIRQTPSGSHLVPSAEPGDHDRFFQGKFSYHLADEESCFDLYVERWENGECIESNLLVSLSALNGMVTLSAEGFTYDNIVWYANERRLEIPVDMESKGQIYTMLTKEEFENVFDINAFDYSEGIVLASVGFADVDQSLPALSCSSVMKDPTFLERYESAHVVRAKLSTRSENEIGIQAISFDNLQLSEDQTFEALDYDEERVLLLIIDTDKRDLRTADDMRAPFCNQFVLYDIAAQEIVEEYPVNQFGDCLSAVAAYDGIFFTWVIHDDDGNAISSIQYHSGQELKRVCPLATTRFSSNTALYRHGESVLFSYENDLTDKEYGIKTISANLDVTDLLVFDGGEEGNVFNGFKASPNYYVYSVTENQQESNRTALYFGSAATEPVELTFSDGKDVYSFDILGDLLLVSHRREAEGQRIFCLETFDLEGNSVEVYPVSEPLYWLCANENGQFCGFPSNGAGDFFSQTDAIEPLEGDLSMIPSRWNHALSNGEQFLVMSLGGDSRSNLFLVTLP